MNDKTLKQLSRSIEGNILLTLLSSTNMFKLISTHRSSLKDLVSRYFCTGCLYGITDVLVSQTNIFTLLYKLEVRKDLLNDKSINLDSFLLVEFSALSDVKKDIDFFEFISLINLSDLLDMQRKIFSNIYIKQDSTGLKEQAVINLEVLDDFNFNAPNEIISTIKDGSNIDDYLYNTIKSYYLRESNK